MERRAESMPSFGMRSKRNREQLHPDLQKVVDEAIKHYDFTIICGYRGQTEQDKAFNEGKSMLRYPKSKHNRYPSHAFDAVPHPLDWSDVEEFKKLQKVMLEAAKTVGVEIVSGGSWKMQDWPHYELKE
jgi:peptidoglycan LD-endopeptidase CwlK